MTQKHDLNIENIKKKKSIKWHLQSKSCFKMSHVENRCTDGGQIYPRANPLNQMHSLNRRCIWNQTEVLILKSLGLVFTSHSSLQVQADYSTSMNKNVGLKKKVL